MHSTNKNQNVTPVPLCLEEDHTVPVPCRTGSSSELVGCDCAPIAKGREGGEGLLLKLNDDVSCGLPCPLL